ncbi:MAG: Holliday junction branch migration DNA helicase RuvB [Syntrophomonadaceae bacterium]|nr:Holliday junction branch migration DNA helicase RuvB [Syntrophomonadaceae bacterium]
MPRLTLLDGQEQIEDLLQVRLRPVRLEDYIGQPTLKKRLGIALKAARKRGEPLEHLLLYGPPGLGKTTLAHIISREMGGNLVTSSGPAIERSGDLMGILTNLQAGDILFIDEIHRLPRPVEEFLYSAMEDFQIDFVVDKGVFAKTVKITLKPFTLVGATTRAGLVSAPMRERFGLLYHLDFYPVEDLQEIVLRSSSILGVSIDPLAAREIASRSRGTPRIANRLLKRVRDYAEVMGDGFINREIAAKSLVLEGIDPLGLDELDLRFLTTIIQVYKGGPVGIEALAATLNEEVDTLQDVVEPYLLKSGFIIRTPSGRKITELGLAHLGLT